MLTRVDGWYARLPLLARSVIGGAIGVAIFYALTHVPDLVPGLTEQRRSVHDLLASVVMFGAMGAVAGGVYGVLWPRLARLGRIGNALAVGTALATAFLALLGYLLGLRDVPLLREPRFWMLIGGVGFGSGLLLGLLWRGARLEPNERAG